MAAFLKDQFLPQKMYKVTFFINFIWLKEAYNGFQYY